VSRGNVQVMKTIRAVVLMWNLHSTNKVPSEVYRSLRKTNTTFISAKKKKQKILANRYS